MGSALHLYHHIPPALIYLRVAALLSLESTGIPVINTTMLLFTGAMASEGHLDLALLICAALLGSTLGACCAYRLGRRYGERLLLRLARLLHIDERKVLFAERWFQRAGGRMIFLSRILPYIRPFACFPAGIYVMPFWRFLAAVASGSLIWCVTILTIGWVLGPRWKLALHLFQAYTLPTVGALLVLLIVILCVKRIINTYLQRQLSRRLEEVSQERDLLGV